MYVDSLTRYLGFCKTHHWYSINKPVLKVMRLIAQVALFELCLAPSLRVFADLLCKHKFKFTHKYLISSVSFLLH